MKILGLNLDSLLGTDPVKQNARAFSRFDRDTPKPDWFFAYRVDYQRPDGAKGTVGLYCNEIEGAQQLFADEFGDSALVIGLSYVDPDHTALQHWLGDNYGQAPAKVKPASGEGLRSAGPDLKDEDGYARANRRAFTDYSKRNPDPEYFFCYQARYRLPSGSAGVIGIMTQSATEAYELFTRRFGTRALITDVDHIDPDHNSLGANNWIDP